MYKLQLINNIIILPLLGRIGGTECSSTCMGSFEGGHHYLHYFHDSMAPINSRATIRTGHETTDWFRIGKRVHQNCMLSLCLFNLYAEYIMRNTGLDEAKQESRLLGEILITSDMQIKPP